jgi:hypothetical protein
VKLRHAAALALVGWYLMVPPVNQTPSGLWRVEMKAPIREWNYYLHYFPRLAWTQDRAAATIFEPKTECDAKATE